jgi:hypothetical protein
MKFPVANPLLWLLAIVAWAITISFFLYLRVR